MQSTTTPKPYLTATLTSNDSILDLSGKQPLTLSITLTLHASAPILCYTEPCDTFFLSRNALTDFGIIFTDCKTKEEVRICHIDSTRRPGYARMLTEKTRLLLRPETPVVFDVGSNIHSDKDTETGFDPWMADLGSVFESEGIYEATLPLYRTLDWWRYAKPSEHEATASSSMDTSNKTTARSADDDDDDVEAKYGVPVLAHEEQLHIYIEGEGVVFSCIGEAMEWPADITEKQRKNKERRDGEEKRKTEELRRGREGKK
jgi:hypothetical protein